MTVGEIAAPVRNALVGGPFGSNLVSRDYVPSGVPVIRGQNLGARWVAGEFAFVSDAKAKTLDANIARPGDIVFTQRGTLGQVSIVPEAPYERYLVSQSQMKLTVNRELTDPLFFYYVFSTVEQQDYIRQNAIQTGVPHTNLGILRGTPVPLPPLPEQRAIAHILGTLDDKIELNRRMNEMLEAMARALFKSWFVDFDPVRAKAADLIRDVALEIGDGYRAKNSELGKPGLPFIRAGNLSNGFDTSGADVLRQDSVAKAGGKLSRPGAVAFTSKGTIGRFARVTEFTEPFVYSPQVCFWRSLDRERLEPAILYCWMMSEDLKSQIDAVAGQTDMAPYVSLRDQRTMEVPIFPESQHAIACRLDTLLVRHALAAEESKTLAALRDTLLPKLISGELRVKNVERFIEPTT
jgi:type I restriction enzyme S subunit